jgi:hypothetical protein
MENKISEPRKYTIFTSNQVKILPQIDIDKKYFLNELLKLLGYADMYFKQRSFMAFYNAGITAAFMAI